MTILLSIVASLLFLFSSLMNFRQTWGSLPLMAKILPLVVTLLTIFVILVLVCPFSHTSTKSKLPILWYRNNDATEVPPIGDDEQGQRLESSAPLAPPSPQPLLPPLPEPPPPEYTDNTYTSNPIPLEVPGRSKRVKFDEMGRAMSVATSVTYFDTAVATDTDSTLRRHDSRRIREPGDIPLGVADAATSTTDDNNKTSDESDGLPPPIPPKQQRLRIPWWNLKKKPSSKTSLTKTSYDLQDVDEDSLRRSDGRRVYESASSIGEHIIPDISIYSSTTSGGESGNESIVILNPVMEETWTVSEASISFRSEHDRKSTTSTPRNSTSETENDRINPRDEGKQIVSGESSLEDHELWGFELSAISPPTTGRILPRDNIRSARDVYLAHIAASLPSDSGIVSRVNPPATSKSCPSESENTDGIRERAISLNVDTISVSDDHGNPERPRTPLPISDISRSVMRNPSLRRTLTQNDYEALDEFAVAMSRLQGSVSRRNARILEQSLNVIKNVLKEDTSATDSSENNPDIPDRDPPPPYQPRDK